MALFGDLTGARFISTAAFGDLTGARFISTAAFGDLKEKRFTAIVTVNRDRGRLTVFFPVCIPLQTDTPSVWRRSVDG
jgi:hypothetical protein